jgi:hypothetical protein
MHHPGRNHRNDARERTRVEDVHINPSPQIPDILGERMQGGLKTTDSQQDEGGIHPGLASQDNPHPAIDGLQENKRSSRDHADDKRVDQCLHLAMMPVMMHIIQHQHGHVFSRKDDSKHPRSHDFCSHRQSPIQQGAYAKPVNCCLMRRHGLPQGN